MVTTTNDSKKYPYDGWDLTGVTARDDAGNTYEQRIVQFHPTRGGSPKPATDRLDVLRAEAKAKGRDLQFNADATDLTSERGIYDAVVFDMPVRGATKLTVTFKGDRLDLGKDFVFEVSKSLWMR